MQRRTRRSALAALAAVTLVVSGCAGTVKNMQEVAPDKAPGAPSAGKAMVVFMRPSGLGFAIQSSVFEVKDTVPALVGIVAAKTKVAYEVEPGNHLFMVVGESADFMSATVLPAKTYYALVTPRMGAMKARFSLRPVHQNELGTAEFNGWVNDCKWVEKSPASDQWATQNMQSIYTKYTEYYAKWTSKPDAERPALLQQDGR